MTKYKVLAEEIDNSDLQYPTEIEMSATNATFVPVTASGPKPANPATDTQTAIGNAQGINNGYYVSATASTAAYTATTFTTDTLTVTPLIGTYAIFYNADVSISGINCQVDIQFFVDGVAVADTLRSAQPSTAILGLITLSTNALRLPMATQGKISFNGTNVLSVRYRVNPATSGAGGVTLNTRNLLLLQTALT